MPDFKNRPTFNGSNVVAVSDFATGAEFGFDLGDPSPVIAATKAGSGQHMNLLAQMVNLLPSIFSPFVLNGLAVTTGTGLQGWINLGSAYDGNQKINILSAVSKTFTASKDTYVDFGGCDGVNPPGLTYSEVANGAAEPSLATGYMRLAKVVTSGAAITSITDRRSLALPLLKALLLSSASLADEGAVGFDFTRHLARFYDGVRQRALSSVGYMPFAYPVGGSPTLTTTVNLAIAANGGTIAIPMEVVGHMLLESVSYWDTATTQARGPVEFALLEDRLDNVNTIDVVSGAVGSLASYTPSAASLRTIPVTSPPIYLAPGSYWLVIKNNHASNALQMGGAAAGTMAVNHSQTKTLTTAAFGSTLDLVAATWTKINQVPGVRLNGRSFGQTTAY